MFETVAIVASKMSDVADAVTSVAENAGTALDDMADRVMVGDRWGDLGLQAILPGPEIATILQVIQIIGIIIPFIGIFSIIIKKDQTKSIVYLLMANMSCLMMNISNLFMVQSNSPATAMQAFKIESFGETMFCFFFMLFVFTYLEIPRPKFIFLAWAIVEALNVIFTWNDHGREFMNMDFEYYESELVNISYINMASSGWTIIRACIIGAMILGTMGLEIYRLVVANAKSEKKNLLSLMIAQIIVLGVLVLSFQKAFAFNLTPVCSSFAVLFLIFRVAQNDLYSLTEMGQKWAVDNFQQIFIIVDTNYKIHYANSYSIDYLLDNFEETIKRSAEKKAKCFKHINVSKVGNYLKKLREINHKAIGVDMDRLWASFKYLPASAKWMFEPGNAYVCDLHGRHFSRMVTELTYKGECVGYSLIMLDVTERNNLLESLSEERDRAEAACRARTDFMSNMSHEIRTPMNAIVGMTDLMLREEVSPTCAEYLMNIQSSGKALLTLVNDILDFSKIDAGKMDIIEEDYDPMSLFNDIRVILLNRIGDKPVSLKFDIDEFLPAKLLGDSLRVRQIIINLGNNATKFTDSGTISVSVKVIENDGETALIRIGIKDTGMGIKEEDINKLFGAFSQVDKRKNHSKEGSGLGLAISKQLVEMMGGEIGVSSVYGEGSEFFFTIPQKVRSTEYAGSIDDAYKKVQREDVMLNYTAVGARILVVDDNEMNRKVALGLLAPLKMDIDTAVDGLDAINKIKKNRYDLVLMDHMMPVMDGCEATSKIRELEGDYYQNLPIIALTANVIASAKKEFSECGMNDYVAKPIEIKALFNCLRKWLPEGLIREADPEAAQQESRAEEEKNERFDDALLKLTAQGFDIDKGIEYTGSKQQLISVLSDYRSLIDVKATKVEKCLADNMIKDYTIEVHALKSTTRMIGNAALSEEFAHLEELGDGEQVDEITSLTPGVLERYRALKEVLSDFKEDDSEKRDASAVEITEIIMALKDANESFDLDSVDAAFMELLGIRLPEGVQAQMDALRAAVADVDMDTINEITDNMIGELK